MEDLEQEGGVAVEAVHACVVREQHGGGWCLIRRSRKCRVGEVGEAEML